MWQGSKCCCGARKVWQQMKADERQVARCTIERLMKR
ncbi:IS3 family transposase [Psychrobacter celer]